MVQQFRVTALATIVACAVGACASTGTGQSAPAQGGVASASLSGVAATTGAPLAGAAIQVCDATGANRSTKAGSDGSYHLDVSGLSAPLLVSARSAAFVDINGIPQPADDTIAYAALLANLKSGNNIANVNQLTDKVSSEVAVADLKLPGTVQLMNACKTAGVKAQTIAAKTADVRALVVDALKAKGVANADGFDPVTTPMKADHTGVDAVLDMVRHNRDGFGSGKDNQLRSSSIFDLDMQELMAGNVKLDPKQKAWSSYHTRVFIIGDSTASNYPLEVAPRMGWGQVFDRELKPGVDAKVVNLAQSGRSSRSFITEGWFKMLADEIKPGDYVLVQWGHNDEKCDKTGSLDWVNRCTYPNSADGKPQVANTAQGLPPGVTADDLSFQRSLEKYVKLAKAKGATPVLITPMTRIVQDKSVKDYDEGLFPITHSTHITTKGDHPGNYSQTVIETAKANKVAVVDLDAMSIAFMNSVNVGTGGPDATGGWRDYHLAVKDFKKYPYYANKKTTGNYLHADRTHFQERGALNVADQVVQGIKADPAQLSGLISLLK